MFSLAPGWHVVGSSEGWHVIRVEQRDAGGLMSFEQARSRLLLRWRVQQEAKARQHRWAVRITPAQDGGGTPVVLRPQWPAGCRPEGTLLRCAEGLHGPLVFPGLAARRVKAVVHITPLSGTLVARRWPSPHWRRVAAYAIGAPAGVWVVARAGAWWEAVGG